MRLGTRKYQQPPALAHSTSDGNTTYMTDLLLAYMRSAACHIMASGLKLPDHCRQQAVISVE